MANPSTIASRLVAVKKEVCTMTHTLENGKIRHSRSVSRSEAAEDEICHLSGKQFFDVVLAKSHVCPPYIVNLPSTVFPILPRATVLVVLRHGGKSWSMSFNGNSSRPRFGVQWRTFATDNKLKFGDACVFELMESSSTEFIFKVHILRGDLPPELLELVDCRGKTSDEPIVLD